MKKEDVEILHEFQKEGEKIIRYKAFKIVKKFSRTAHVILPKDFVGKRVLIMYPEE